MPDMHPLLTNRENVCLHKSLSIRSEHIKMNEDDSWNDNDVAGAPGSKEILFPCQNDLWEEVCEPMLPEQEDEGPTDYQGHVDYTADCLDTYDRYDSGALLFHDEDRRERREQDVRDVLQGIRTNAVSLLSLSIEDFPLEELIQDHILHLQEYMSCVNVEKVCLDLDLLGGQNRPGSWMPENARMLGESFARVEHVQLADTCDHRYQYLYPVLLDAMADTTGLCRLRELSLQFLQLDNCAASLERVLTANQQIRTIELGGLGSHAVPWWEEGGLEKDSLECLKRGFASNTSLEHVILRDPPIHYSLARFLYQAMLQSLSLRKLTLVLTTSKAHNTLALHEYLQVAPLNEIWVEDASPRSASMKEIFQLVTGSNIRRLFLSCFALTLRDIEALSTLSFSHLSLTKLRTQSHVLVAFVENLMGNVHLRTLALESDDVISDNDSWIIVTTLVKHPTLEILKFWTCKDLHCSNSGGLRYPGLSHPVTFQDETFVQRAGMSTGLRELVLRDVGITTDRLCYLLEVIRESNVVILDISCNEGIGDTGAQMLANFLCGANIKSLAMNHIGLCSPQAAGSLWVSLTMNSKLEELQILGNEVSLGVLASCLPLMILQRLSLSCGTLPTEVAVALRAGFESNMSLLHVAMIGRGAILEELKAGVTSFCCRNAVTPFEGRSVSTTSESWTNALAAVARLPNQERTAFSLLRVSALECPYGLKAYRLAKREQKVDQSEMNRRLKPRHR